MFCYMNVFNVYVKTYLTFPGAASKILVKN